MQKLKERRKKLIKSTCLSNENNNFPVLNYDAEINKDLNFSNVYNEKNVSTDINIHKKRKKKLIKYIDLSKECHNLPLTSHVKDIEVIKELNSIDCKLENVLADNKKQKKRKKLIKYIDLSNETNNCSVSSHDKNIEANAKLISDDDNWKKKSCDFDVQKKKEKKKHIKYIELSNESNSLPVSICAKNDEISSCDYNDGKISSDIYIKKQEKGNKLTQHSSKSDFDISPCVKNLMVNLIDNNKHKEKNKSTKQIKCIDLTNETDNFFLSACVQNIEVNKKLISPDDFNMRRISSNSNMRKHCKRKKKLFGNTDADIGDKTNFFASVCAKNFSINEELSSCNNYERKVSIDISVKEQEKRKEKLIKCFDLINESDNFSVPLCTENDEDIEKVNYSNDCNVKNISTDSIKQKHKKQKTKLIKCFDLSDESDNLHISACDEKNMVNDSLNYKNNVKNNSSVNNIYKQKKSKRKHIKNIYVNDDSDSFISTCTEINFNEESSLFNCNNNVKILMCSHMKKENNRKRKLIECYETDNSRILECTEKGDVNEEFNILEDCNVKISTKSNKQKQRKAIECVDLSKDFDGPCPETHLNIIGTSDDKTYNFVNNNTLCDSEMHANNAGSKNKK